MNMSCCLLASSQSGPSLQKLKQLVHGEYSMVLRYWLCCWYLNILF